MVSPDIYVAGRKISSREGVLDEQLQGRVLSPTLFIGLGGTGKAVLMRLRRKLFEEYGRFTDPAVRYLVLDTDAQPFAPGEGNQSLYNNVALQKDLGEFIDCTIRPRDFHDVFSMMCNNHDRRYESWLYPRLKDVVPDDALNRGAGTFRQVGRLAFFLRYHDIRDTIKRHFKQMLEHAADRPREVFGRPGEVAPNSLEIVIITSLAGGTGSGMFIDTAYLVRDILMNETEIAEVRAAPIALIAVLPHAFEEKHRSLAHRFRQNAYAALMEMEQYSTPRPMDEPWNRDDEEGVCFKVNWSDPRGADKLIRMRAWDTCYLVDDVNDIRAGGSLELDDLFQMISDYLFLDLHFAAFAATKRSLRSNFAQLRDCYIASQVHDENESTMAAPILFENKYGCTFSSFGVAELFIDKERIERSAALRMLAQVVKRRWLGSPVSQASELDGFVLRDLCGETVIGGVETIYMEPNRLAERFRKRNDKLWLDIVQESFDALRKKSPSRREIESALSRHQSQLREISSELGASSPASQETVRSVMMTTVRELIGDRRRFNESNLGILGNRLRSLYQYRLDTLGIEPTLQLLERYSVKLRQWILEVERRKVMEPVDREALFSRLEDAQLVGWPCKMLAMNVEYNRAVSAACDSVKRWYLALMNECLEVVYRTLDGDVRAPEARSPADPRQTLLDKLRQLSEFAKKLLTRIEARFHDLQRVRESQRRQSVLPLWTTDDYDREVERRLLQHVGANPYAKNQTEADWHEVNRRLLEDVGKKESGAIDSFAVYLERACETYRRNPDFMDHFIDHLSESCRKILGGVAFENYGEGNVINYLISFTDDQRREKLASLIDYSAPYFPFIAKQRFVADPDYQNLLGLPSSETQALGWQRDNPRESILTTIKEISSARGGGTRDIIGHVKDAQPTTVTLVREVGGLPLHYYRRLPDLESAYFSDQLRDRRASCHLSWRVTSEDLPDIVRLTDEEKKILREHVDIVIWGFLLQFIKRSSEGVFFVEVPSPYGWGTHSVELGTKMTRIIRHACRQPEVRQFLQNSWINWLRKAGGCDLAVLYTAIKCNLKFLQSCTAEVQSVPLFNCFLLVFRETEIRLTNHKEGKLWQELLREPTADDPPEKIAQTANALKEIEEICLVKADPSRLPLYQINLRSIRELEQRNLLEKYGVVK